MVRRAEEEGAQGLFGCRKIVPEHRLGGRLQAGIAIADGGALVRGIGAVSAGYIPFRKQHVAERAPRLR
jgi:hypothetical protein